MSSPRLAPPKSLLRALTAALVLCLLASGMTPAMAEKKKEPEPFPESYTKPKAALEKEAKGKDRGAIERAVTVLAKAAVKTDREDVRKDALKVIRPHLKYTRAKEDICMAAIKALGELKVKNSSASLMALGQKKRSKRIPKLLRRHALFSIAKIQDKRSIEVVLEYLKSPRPDKTARYMAVAAAEAVGLYATLPAKKKFAVMKEVMKAWADLYSAAGGYFMTSADAAEWWGETYAPMLKSFNKVLRRQLLTYKEAEHWWRKNRKKVQKGVW